jgi:hypothetical protein
MAPAACTLRRAFGFEDWGQGAGRDRRAPLTKMLKILSQFRVTQGMNIFCGQPWILARVDSATQRLR